MIDKYICPATFISMMITSMVSHGPGAPETGPVCYGGAEEGTASKACVHSKHTLIPTEFCRGKPDRSCPRRFKGAGPRPTPDGGWGWSFIPLGVNATFSLNCSEPSEPGASPGPAARAEPTARIQLGPRAGPHTVPWEHRRPGRHPSRDSVPVPPR
jgi:hypothetical protein